MSDSVRPHPWDYPGKNTGVGCHFLLQCIKVKVKSLSHVWLSATRWTAAHQAPPSMGFSRKEHWSGVPLPSPLATPICLYVLSGCFPTCKGLLCPGKLISFTLWPFPEKFAKPRGGPVAQRGTSASEHLYVSSSGRMLNLDSASNK